MKHIPDTKTIVPGIVNVSPPDQIIDGGVAQIYTIDPDDIRSIDVEKGTVINIKMKRRGTYHGKRYNRPVLPFSFK